MAAVGRGADQYTVRFPEGLRDRIKAAAETNGRSMNAEIVSTLEEVYPPGVSVGELLSMMEEMARQIENMPANERLEPVSRKLADTLERVRESAVFISHLDSDHASQQQILEYWKAARRNPSGAIVTDGDPDTPDDS